MKAEAPVVAIAPARAQDLIDQGADVRGGGFASAATRLGRQRT